MGEAGRCQREEHSVPDPADPAPIAKPLRPRLLQDTASIFGLLSAPVRLHILWLLAGGERDVGTLADHTGQTVATVSHHLGKLKLAGLVHDRRQGKRRVYAAADPDVIELVRLAIGRRVAGSRVGARKRRA